MIEECEMGSNIDRNGPSFYTFSLKKAEALIQQDKFEEAEVRYIPFPSYRVSHKGQELAQTLLTLAPKMLQVVKGVGYLYMQQWERTKNKALLEKVITTLTPTVLMWAEKTEELPQADL